MKNNYGQLYSLLEWQEQSNEKPTDKIYLLLKKVYDAALLHERLDALVALKKAIQPSGPSTSPTVIPETNTQAYQSLLAQTDLFIRFILNAKDDDEAEALLQERELFRWYKPDYVTPLPDTSPLATALEETHARKNHIKKSLTLQKAYNQTSLKHMILALKNGRAIRTLDRIEQTDDYLQQIKRFSPEEKEAFRLLPCKKLNKLIQIKKQGLDHHTKLVIHAADTRDNTVKNMVKGIALLVVTLDGDIFISDTVAYKQCHSSLANIAFFAGLIKIQNGKLRYYSNSSGHFKTGSHGIYPLTRYFNSIGVLNNETAIMRHIRTEADARKIWKQTYTHDSSLREEIRNLPISKRLNYIFTQQLHLQAELLKGYLSHGSLDANEKELTVINRADTFTNKNLYRNLFGFTYRTNNARAKKAGKFVDTLMDFNKKLEHTFDQMRSKYGIENFLKNFFNTRQLSSRKKSRNRLVAFNRAFIGKISKLPLFSEHIKRVKKEHLETFSEKLKEEIKLIDQEKNYLTSRWKRTLLELYNKIPSKYNRDISKAHRDVKIRIMAKLNEFIASLQRYSSSFNHLKLKFDLLVYPYRFLSAYQQANLADQLQKKASKLWKKLHDALNQKEIYSIEDALKDIKNLKLLADEKIKKIKTDPCSLFKYTFSLLDHIVSENENAVPTPISSLTLSG